MRIVDRILDILDSMEAVQTVLHESPSYTNIKVDRKPAPYAILYLLTDMEIDLSRGYAVDGCDVEVFFADLVKLDADGPTHQAVVDRMAAVARQFVSLLLADKSLRFGDKVELKTAYGRFDKNVTGVSLLIHAEDRQGSCVDSEEPEVRTVEITANGEYDVTHYGTAVVSVPSHGVVLQDKTVTANGVVRADAGYDGLQSVTVAVECPTPEPRLQEKTAVANGYVTFDDGYDGLQGVTVAVECPEPEIRLQDKTAEENGLVTADAGYDGLQSVTVAVPQPQGSTSVTIEENTTTVVDVTDYESISILTDVPAPALSLQTKTAVTNGYVTYDAGYDGLQGVNVSVPLPQGNTDRTIESNGTEVVDVTDYETITITTAVPAPALSLQTKTAVTNGYVTFDTGYDGLQGVNVAVPLPQGSTSVTITENTTTDVDVTDYESISVVTAVPSVQKWVGTTAQYQALAPNYDENTLYLTTD